jgi:hypothetical protein
LNDAQAFARRESLVGGQKVDVVFLVAFLVPPVYPVEVPGLHFGYVLPRWVILDRTFFDAVAPYDDEPNVILEPTDTPKAPELRNLGRDVASDLAVNRKNRQRAAKRVQRGVGYRRES